MLKRRPKFALLLTTFYLYTNSSPIIFEGTERFSSLVKLPHWVDRGSSTSSRISPRLAKYEACLRLQRYVGFTFSSWEKRRKKKRNERRKEYLYNTQFTLHTENSERFSIDLDFSLWTRVTLTFIYEDIIITWIYQQADSVSR